MTQLRIVLVEDNLQFQDAIRSLLSSHCEIVGVFGIAEGLAEELRAHDPHVLVLDVSLPGRSGLQVLPEIRRDFPLLAIVIANNHSDETYRLAAFERGADAFVAKISLFTDLLPAIPYRLFQAEGASDLDILSLSF